MIILIRLVAFILFAFPSFLYFFFWGIVIHVRVYGSFLLSLVFSLLFFAFTYSHNPSPDDFYKRFIVFHFFPPLINQTHENIQQLGRPSTSADAKKCILWDAVEERHAQEVCFQHCFLHFLLPPSISSPFIINSETNPYPIGKRSS